MNSKRVQHEDGARRFQVVFFLYLQQRSEFCCSVGPCIVFFYLEEGGEQTTAAALYSQRLQFR